MKVEYKNLRARKYKNLAQIKFDIEFLQELIKDHGEERYKRDLVIAREMYKTFKIINNL